MVATLQSLRDPLKLFTDFAVTAPSYIIFKDNTGNIYAKNGRTGSIEFSGTDASTVIQAVFDAVNLLGGGYVHVKSGTYYIRQAINLPESGHLMLTGDGAEFTIFQVPVGYDNHIFRYTGTKTENSYFNHFSDFQMIGNRAAGAVNNTGFLLDSTNYGITDTIWRDVFFRGFAQDCVYLNSYNSWANVFERCTFEHAARSLLYHAGGSDLRVINNKFLYCHGLYAIVDQADHYNNYICNWFYNNDKRAIHIGGGAYHNSFIGNIFAGDSAANAGVYDDIYVEHGDRNIFLGNNFVGGTYSGIRFYSASCQDNLVLGNLFYGSYGGKPIVDAGTRTTIKHNKGFVTENTGTATFSGTGAQTVFTIAHGLAAAPTAVSLEAKTADASGAKYWTADATNITVTFTTAPPSGTDNVVISWEAAV
jgi:hypothetical protein